MKKDNNTHSRRAFLRKSAKIGGAGILGAIGISTLEGSNLIKEISRESTANNTNTTTQGAMMNKLTPNAKSRVARLFNNADMPLMSSDGEFLSNYINFAFDEVVAHSKLDEKERLLLTLGSLVATQSISEYKIMLQASLNMGVSPIAIKEVLYQATPYVGIGRVLECLMATNEIFTNRGIKLPLKPQGTTNRDNRQAKGLEVQRKFFGEAIDKGNASAPRDEKHIRAFLSANCFGDYYTRDGLELQFRELLTFAILLSLGGADSQLKAHIQGNLNVGNDRAKLIATITALIPYVGYPRALNALSALDEISPAR